MNSMELIINHIVEAIFKSIYGKSFKRKRLVIDEANKDKVVSSKGVL